MKVAEIPLYKGSESNHPKRIILHAMGEFIDTDNKDYFAVDFLQSIGLSAHALITPSGVIIRSRKDTQGAYHAKGHNTDTLGVEFLVKGLHTYTTFLETIKSQYLTDPQYYAGLELVRTWMDKWSISKENVLTHAQIDPNRKKDPGIGFIEQGFINEL